MNRDFVEMLSALSEAGAEYLLVGAHALAAYGIPRATGDIDILTGITGVTFDGAWPRRTSVNLPGVVAPVIGREDFVVNKRAAGRPKDLADLALLAEGPSNMTA